MNAPADSAGFWDRLDDRVLRGARLVTLIGGVGLVLLSAITIVDVLGRAAFSAPLDGANDYLSMLVVIVAAWQLVPVVLEKYATNANSGHLRLPVWPVWTLATFLVWLNVPVQAIVTLVQVRRAVSPPQESEERRPARGGDGL